MKKVYCLVLSIILTCVATNTYAENRKEFESYTLNIYLSQGSSEGHAAFQQLYPNVTIEHEDYLTKDEIYTMVLTRSSQVDMFGSNSASLPTYPDLIRGGFYAPIKSEKLLAYADNCYPGVRDAIFINDKLVGIPVKCMPSRQVGVEKSMWYKLGLNDDALPTTWLELIDFIINEWPNYADAYPDWCAMHSDDYNLLFYEFLSSYNVYRQRSTIDPSYDTQVFRDTMNAYLSIDPKVFEGENDEKQALFSAYEQVTPQIPSIYSKTHYTVLPVGVDSNNAAVMVTLLLIVINPYSKNRELCESYLECLVDNLEAEQLPILQKDYSTPVKWPGWANFAERYEKTIDEYKERINAADDDAEKATIQLELETYIAQGATRYNNPWFISEESLREFRTQVSDLHIYWDEMLNDREWQMYLELCENIHRRTIPIDMIVDRLNRLYYFRTLED